jgi:predicted acylesterase/phospholipase RssA
MIQPRAHLNLHSVDTIIFAGGGNRCWWQSGAMSYFMQLGWRMPKNIVGTSAGAGVATSLVLKTHEDSLIACEKLYAENESIFDKTSKGLLKFAHRHIYPAWLDSILHPSNHHELIQAQSQIHVAIARPSKILGLTGSILAGTFAYMVDKYVSHKIHPTLAMRLGLTMDTLLLNESSNLESAKNLLLATAAAPPFQEPRMIKNQLAIDGGYVDNVPLIEQAEINRKKTLVLLTRHYPKLPTMFDFNDRIYWQASQKIPVSTWDCTQKTIVRDAFNLGESDAKSVLQNKLITIL